jgi:streptogramin lyase
MQKKRIVIAAALIVFALSVITFVYLVPTRNAPSCGEELGTAKISSAQLQSAHFGAVTKYRLPKPEKFPNAIEVARDGSVWFGEQTVPGIGHLYLNGTYVEYSWPFNYSPSTTAIWGIANWNGKIWATDALGAQLVGLDPSSGQLVAVKLPNATSFPYTTTVAPDGSLWFTELYGDKIGKLSLSCQLSEYKIPTSFGGTPTQIAFVNNTFGYYIDAGNATSGIGSVLSFNPAQFTPHDISPAIDLYAPSGIAISTQTGKFWVTQHGASSLAAYDQQRDSWAVYPTSTITYQSTTLPYFVATNGSLVWFNEHYANRMAVLDSHTGLLTEYSLSDPPANQIIGIDNALTFALGKDKAWFTELTANYIGFVDASYVPSFSASAQNQSIMLEPGAALTATVVVKGISSTPLTMQFADSENITSQPQDIEFSSNATRIPSLNGQLIFQIKVSASSNLEPGKYTLLVSVTDGLIYRDCYITLDVTA